MFPFFYLYPGNSPYLCIMKKLKKPIGTFYVDYFTQDGEMFVIFETVDGRVIHKSIGNTKCNIAELRLTEFYVFINPIYNKNIKQIFTVPKLNYFRK